ncbi:patched domain-containing protein 3 [Salarias fasciatus]|nr:patched domain-containing protein 3-like [Salarias fasciatus]
MARFHSDCIEGPLRTCFSIMGHFIGSHPWWFIIVPLSFSVSLGSGFYFLKDRTSNDLEEQFTPVGGPAKMERKYMEETFPGNGSTFSRLRLSRGGSYATVIATNSRNVLTAESLQEVLDVDVRIRGMVLQHHNQSFKYVDICAEVQGSCVQNDFLSAIEYNSSRIDSISLTYPWFHNGNRRVPVYLSLGSVEMNPGSSTVRSAKAVQLYYYLEDDGAKTDVWLRGFIDLVSNESPSLIQVSYSTSRSMQWEFDKTPSSVVHLFSITYTVAIAFSVLTCWRLDSVRTKLWVALCGVVSAGLAVLSAVGVLLLLGQPFVLTAASCPFLILGIGLDDMFILISSWQRTRVLDAVPDRLAEAYRDAAVSISITSLTDALALLLGCSSPFGSVRSFCLYAGVSVCFCYLYSITFLGACMAINGRREAGNRHWFTCRRSPEDSSAGSEVFRMCCVGGRYDQNTELEETDPISYIFEHFYGPCLTHKITKACVIMVYVAYLAVSIYGVLVLQEGLDVRNLALDDSYIVPYLSRQREHFSEYSCSVMVAVRQPFCYWDPDQQAQLQACISHFESLDFVNSTLAWFTSYRDYAEASSLNISSRESFHTHLPQFLQLSPTFRADLNLTAGGHVRASRFFVQMLNRTGRRRLVTGLRRAAESCPVQLLVFHPAFVYLDQDAVIVGNAVQTVLAAVAAMLMVSLVLIPGPLCSVLVTLAVCSVLLGVAGFMSLWAVSLDSISLINLIMCVGFSVDFSAHVSYAFVSSAKSDVDGKVGDALARLGRPILQGAASTVLGVAALSLSGSYIFRTFFRIVLLVSALGLLHSLVFIPVFLTVLAACRR